MFPSTLGYGFCSDHGQSVPKGPRTQIIGFWGPNTINNIVFGPYNYLGPTTIINNLGPWTLRVCLTCITS